MLKTGKLVIDYEIVGSMLTASTRIDLLLFFCLEHQSSAPRYRHAGVSSVCAVNCASGAHGSVSGQPRTVERLICSVPVYRQSAGSVSRRAPGTSLAILARLPPASHADPEVPD